MFELIDPALPDAASDDRLVPILSEIMKLQTEIQSAQWEGRDATAYYGQLVGAKIAAYWESDDGFPTFGLVHPKLGAMVIEVSQDPEGNGEGFLFITDKSEVA